MMNAQRPLPYLIAAGLALLAAAAWWQLRPGELGEGFASGNGRIEATEMDVATKLAGRIAHIEVDEGDFVQPGQFLARMDTQELDAQLRQARSAGAPGGEWPTSPPGHGRPAREPEGSAPRPWWCSARPS